MGRRTFVLLLVANLAASCTGEAAPPRPGPTATPAGPVVAPIVLRVIAATDPATPAGQDDRSYLSGMELAVDAINARGGLDGRPVELATVNDGGDTTRARRALRAAIGEQPAALLFVGPGPVVAPLRDDLIRSGVPLMLFQGDLYSTRDLVRPVFQTSIPWEWQARVIARYLVVDRKAKRIVYVGIDPDAAARAGVAAAAVGYWGGSLTRSVTVPPSGGLNPVVDAARAADAVMLDAPPVDSRRTLDAIGRIADPPRVVGGSGVLAAGTGSANAEAPPPGTTACYTYSWAGWAEPIPRVGKFVRRIEQAFGAPPTGFEQEGHDAIRTLAAALGATGGRGGQALIEALEDIRGAVYSSFPVDLGPDDHLFLPRDELGLFAVAGPKEKLDPWQQRTAVTWRGLMRTFTYDGERNNILDRDRPVFFPRWKEPQPGPYYWKSRYGITTRPSDPLH